MYTAVVRTGTGTAVVQMCMLARAARYRNFLAFSTVAVTNRLKTIDLCIAPID